MQYKEVVKFLEARLTVREVASLKGCTEQYIRKLCLDNKIRAITVEGIGGASGKNYSIPLSALDPRLQKKYYKQQAKTIESQLTITVEEEPPPVLNLETITADQRRQIAIWKTILNQWDIFRTDYKYKGKGTMAEADEAFVNYQNTLFEKQGEEITLSVKKLYRKEKDFREKGEAALYDKRGEHSRGKMSVSDEAWDIFTYYYLIKGGKKKWSVQLCLRETKKELEQRYKEAPKLPTHRTFLRYVENKITLPQKVWNRGNEHEWKAIEPSIRRAYDMEVNETWVADGHEFNVFVRDKNGNVFRPNLTAFLDVRTRKFMGWVVTKTLNGDATIYALKKGVEKYGTPKRIYTDNGREYLFKDFSGDAGHRKTAKVKEGEFVPPTILANLGINMTVALPKNAKAKIIERAFYTVKENFEKLFPTYTGGSINEKPDDLNEILKKQSNIPHIDEFVKLCDGYLQNNYNKQSHTGDGMFGNSPDEMYNRLIVDVEKRVLTQDQLNLMFMRLTKSLKVGKNGISFTYYGEKLSFISETLIKNHYGQQVYVAYEPENLQTVRLYDTENRFICTAELDEKLSAYASKEKIQAKTKKNKELARAMRTIKKHDGLVQLPHDPISNLLDQYEIEEIPEQPKILRITSNARVEIKSEDELELEQNGGLVGSILKYG